MHVEKSATSPRLPAPSSGVRLFIQLSKVVLANGGRGNWSEMPVIFACTLRSSWLELIRFATGAMNPEPSAPSLPGSPSTLSWKVTPFRLASLALKRIRRRGTSTAHSCCWSTV